MVAINKQGAGGGRGGGFFDRTCFLACGVCFFVTLVASTFAFLAWNILEAPNDNNYHEILHQNFRNEDGSFSLPATRGASGKRLGDGRVGVVGDATSNVDSAVDVVSAPMDSIFFGEAAPEGGGEYVRLRSGAYMPAIGFGTCCRPSSQGEAIYKSALAFLKNGGRLIDTAQAYENSGKISKAIRDSGIPREEVWITNKVSLLVKTQKDAVETIDHMLRNMRIQYLDLVLIHMPWNGKEATIEVWKGLIDAKRRGYVKAIGVSNFSKMEIEDLIDATGVVPEVNQIQFHPWSPKGWKILSSEWMKEQGIATTAYNSLGGSRFHSSQNKQWPDAVTRIAEKHRATEAQLMLRWGLIRGASVIPGATSEEHIRENLLCPRFELTLEEMDAIENSVPPEDWWKVGKDKFAKFSSESALASAWTNEGM